MDLKRNKSNFNITPLLHRSIIPVEHIFYFIWLDDLSQTKILHNTRLILFLEGPIHFLNGIGA